MAASSRRAGARSFRCSIDVFRFFSGPPGVRPSSRAAGAQLRTWPGSGVSGCPQSVGGRRGLLTLEHAPAQPGVQPKLQPLAGEAVGLQRAPGKVLSARLPALAHGAEGVQVLGVRHGAVVGEIPPELEAGVAPGHGVCRLERGGLNGVEGHGIVPVGGGHHAQP